MQESSEWPSAPNEWPEATNNEKARESEDEVVEEVIEEVIEETFEMEDVGDAPPAIVSPAVERLKTKKGSVVLSVSSEDMEKKGVEFLLQRMMEECNEQDEENQDDEEE